MKLCVVGTALLSLITTQAYSDDVKSSAKTETEESSPYDELNPQTVGSVDADKVDKAFVSVGDHHGNYSSTSH